MANVKTWAIDPRLPADVLLGARNSPMTQGDAAAKAAIRAARIVDSRCADTYRTIVTLRNSIGSSTVCDADDDEDRGDDEQRRTPRPGTAPADPGRRRRRRPATRSTGRVPCPGSVSWAMIVTTAALATKKPRSSPRSVASGRRRWRPRPETSAPRPTRLRRPSSPRPRPPVGTSPPPVDGRRAPDLGKIRVNRAIWGSSCQMPTRIFPRSSGMRVRRRGR